ncbi:MAG TPA: TIGR01777 family oxidoreductase [Rhizomicrobium sp.]|nr:TIGR01777 family oxidoreductase [Rhizomicrobium sp.]
MTSPLLWILLTAQIFMGGFDTLFHHELTERLAWRPTQRRELMLHGARNLLYAPVFAALGWSAPHGRWALALLAILAVELLITLADFVEEDLTRKLPASERVTHTLLALNYGAILALLLPVLAAWAREPTALAPARHGLLTALTSVAACGVIVSGVRDLLAAARTRRLAPPPAADLVRALGDCRCVLVTGATGFVGRRFVEALVASGREAIVLTRDPAKARALPPPFRLVTALDQIRFDTRIDAIVHLAGEPVAGGLWTTRRRRAIVESRVRLSADLRYMIARLKTRPSVFVEASAVGWYGLHGDEILDETGPANPCFSHESCAAVEAEAAKVEQGYGIRSVALRIGLVLGTEGGMLGRLLFPFECGLGGRIGSGRQWMSWIARDDLVRLIAHVIATPSLSGPVNATAPEPVRNAEFARALGRALRRPALLPVPAAPLRWAAGAFAEELLLGGQRVVPARAQASGFVFRHPTLAPALAAILGRGARARPKPWQEHVPLAAE